MSKKVKRKKLKVKNLFLLFFALLILSFLFFLLSGVKVRSFYVKGNTYYTDDEILKMTELNKYPSFLFTNSYNVSSKVKNNKLIKNIKIKKNIFFEFYVIVNEKKALYNDLDSKKLVLEDGEKVDINNINVPTLINKIDNKKVKAKLNKKMLKINNNVLNTISEIKYDPNYIDKERFLVSMNDGNYVYLTLSKFQAINKYSRISKTLGEKNGVLYLDYGNYFLSQ